MAEQGLALIDKQTGEITERPQMSAGMTVAAATEVASVLTRVIEDKKLYSMISGRKHVRLEGWTTLGALCGPVLGDAVFPVLVWSRPIENGFEARVEARTYTGQLVGAAEAQCTRDEATWSKRDDYALRSMAQTRASSKALRIPLGWIVQIAGFDATPAEEMPEDAKQTPVQRETAADVEKRAWAALYAAGRDYGITTQVQMHEFFHVPPEKGALTQYAKDRARVNKTTVAAILRTMRDELPERVAKKKDLDATFAETADLVSPVVKDVEPEQVSFEGEVPAQEAE